MRYLFVLVLISVNALAITAAPIDENVFIPDLNKLKYIETHHPELVIDHPSSEGFELYGPKGMKKWLTNSGIDFTESFEAIESEINKSLIADYPTYEEMTARLKRIVAKNPSIIKMFSIGKSVQGRELWFLKISDNVNVDENEPEFKYISSMHGDEITGRELMVEFIDELVSNYGKGGTETSLINNTEIYIMPSMNPDGSHLRRRSNGKRVDLNRNFPDIMSGEPNSWNRREVETKAIMKFQAQRNFALSANFHGGSVVVNYPWDSTYDRHPFDKLIKKISLRYAESNGPMRNSRRFRGGVTNGADWYKVLGGMQDWSYFWHNDLQVTVELSQMKWPQYSAIPSFYRDNRDSLVNYVSAIHQGAGFYFDDKSTKGTVYIYKVVGSQIKDFGTYGFNRGEFYKVLEEGIYQLRVTTDDKTYNIQMEVDRSINFNGNYTKL